MSDTGKTIIALGTFDGVHLGHRALIETAMDIGRERGMTAVIYTFKTHPMEAFNRAPEPIMPNAERINELKSFGCRVIAEDFTREYAAMQPEEFVRMLLRDHGMGAAVAGFNYSFGAGGLGDVKLLKQLGRELGFDVFEISPAYCKNEVISSTRIRAALREGDIPAVNAMSGRKYALTGKVISNRHIGSSLGFPTANMDLSERLLPAAGVYATWAELETACYRAVTNIGKNPTVGGEKTTVETHIIGYSGDLYGERLTVKFVSRLRGEIRFDGLEALSAQISKDVDTALKILS